MSADGWATTPDCFGKRCDCKPCVCRYGRLIQDAPGGLTVAQIEDEKLRRELAAWESRFSF